MRIGGTILSALLVLGACSSEAAPREPTTSATTSATTPTPSTTPTTVAPTMSKQAGEDSPEGAAAFVKHYIDVFNYAAATGDVDELTRLSSPDCKGCQNYIKLYRDTYAAGGYFKGGEWTTGPLEMKFRGTATYATTDVSTGGGRFRKSRRADEKASKRDTTRITFALKGSGQNREVTQMALGGIG